MLVTGVLAAVFEAGEPDGELPVSLSPGDADGGGLAARGSSGERKLATDRSSNRPHRAHLHRPGAGQPHRVGLAEDINIRFMEQQAEQGKTFLVTLAYNRVEGTLAWGSGHGERTIMAGSTVGLCEYGRRILVAI